MEDLTDIQSDVLHIDSRINDLISEVLELQEVAIKTRQKAKSGSEEKTWLRNVSHTLDDVLKRLKHIYEWES